MKWNESNHAALAVEVKRNESNHAALAVHVIGATAGKIWKWPLPPTKGGPRREASELLAIQVGLGSYNALKNSCDDTLTESQGLTTVTSAGRCMPVHATAWRMKILALLVLEAVVRRCSVAWTVTVWLFA